MSGKNWDRVPIDAQSIDAPLSRAAVFLVVTVASEPTTLANVCSALDGLDDLIKTVGFRDLSAPAVVHRRNRSRSLGSSSFRPPTAGTETICADHGSGPCGAVNTGRSALPYPI
jgi:hypothetical protein